MAVADRFLLDVANRRRLSADLTDAVLSIDRTGTMETAQAFPSISVVVDDPRDRLMESHVLVRPAKRELGTADARALRPIDVLLDGVWYRLRKASRAGDAVTLAFHHRGVVYMAQHDTPMSASRNDETRAQFIRRQVLEAGRKRGAGHKLAFWAWELRRRMPIAAASEETSQRAEPDRDVADTTTRASSGKGLTVKGSAMNAAQRNRAARIIGVQEELDAPAKARVAQFCAAIGESRLGEDLGSRGTTFQTTVIPESDLEGQARAFLQGGRSFVAGGAIGLAKQPGLTPGDIASRTEISDKGGAFYNAHKREAEAILEAMGGGGGGSASSSEPGSYTKPYRFRRPRGEDGWANTGKLADDVKRRRFVTIPVRGSDLFVYAGDVDLLRLRSQAVLDLEADYIISAAEYDLDYGKTVRGMRLSVAGDPFDADFAWGLPVTVRGGPGGKWIVWEVHEVDGSPVVELDLRMPQPAGLEPRSETVQRADASDSSRLDDDSATGKFVARGKSISEQNLPYVWGGGHARVGTPDGGTGRDPGTGYDCSGYVSACAHSAGMWPEGRTSAMGSGELASSWGEPGEGERITVYANAGHTFAKVSIPGERVKWIDTSREAGGPSGPHVRYGSRSTAGYTARHWPGT